MNELLDEAVHSMPQFGPEHACSPRCWCHPQIINGREIELGEHDAYIYLHNVVH